jgi:hypothetical protein
MQASSALLVPSHLPPQADAGVVQFVLKLRDEVVVPLFGASSAEEFMESLPDLAARGAILRFRWINSLVELPEDQQTTILNTWLQPPAHSLRVELQRLAAQLLGDERSFQLERALAMIFSDTVEFSARLHAKVSNEAMTSRALVHVARLAEVGAAHDVLSIGWMMVLFGDVPRPRPDVIYAAADQLFAETSHRLETMRMALLDANPTRHPVPLTWQVPPGWLDTHRALSLPLWILLGMAFDDPAVRTVAVAVTNDPEDVGLVWLQIRLGVAEDAPDDVRLRLEDRALRAGVLGAMMAKQAVLMLLVQAADV